MGIYMYGHIPLYSSPISLSLYKVVVDYLSPTSLNPHYTCYKTPLFAFKDYFKTLTS